LLRISQINCSHSGVIASASVGADGGGLALSKFGHLLVI
jgi:hypothetical protein